MKRKSAVAVACLTFFLCMTTVTHAKGTVLTTRVNTVAKTGWQYTNDNWYYYDANGISKQVGFLMAVTNTTYIQTVRWQKVGYLPMGIINT